MDRLTESVVTILVAIIGLATLAVIVGRNSRTTQVIGAAGSAFNSALGTAISPVTGGGGGANVLNFGNAFNLGG